MFWIYIKLAWRNLFRNKRRSFIAGTAIGIGLASLIFTDALILGMKENMVRSGTASFLGEGQIHCLGFRKTQEVEKTIRNADEIVGDLEKEAIVRHFTPRVLSLAMITSAANMSSISLVGVNPSSEQYLSQVDEALREGNYFSGQGERDILIGSQLAGILEVKLGDRVVASVAQARSGDISQEMFRVSGIFHFNVREMDQGMAFVRLKKAQELLGIGQGIHEIAIQFTDIHISQQEDNPFWKKYSRDGNEALGWIKLLPQMKAALELTDFSIFLVAAILFGVVALGIVNTLFMSLHERIFEFGVLRAVGTRRFGIARLIIFEAGALAVLSIVLGSILGFLLTYIVSRTGIDYTGIEFSGVTFRELIYPVLKAHQFISFPFWVFVFTLVVGIYPAVYAARIAPAEAMRKSL